MPEAWPALWRFCVSLTGNRDQAEDLAQSTCLRAIERASGFEPGTRLDRWMMRIAHRIWLNDIRSRKVRQGEGLVAIEEQDIRDEKNLSAETNIFVTEVFKEIGNLPEAQRHTVMLVYVEGMSYREAAEILEIPVGTVMSRLATARKSLQSATQTVKRSDR